MRWAEPSNPSPRHRLRSLKYTEDNRSGNHSHSNHGRANISRELGTLKFDSEGEMSISQVIDNLMRDSTADGRNRRGPYVPIRKWYCHFLIKSLATRRHLSRTAGFGWMREKEWPRMVPQRRMFNRVLSSSHDHIALDAASRAKSGKVPGTLSESEIWSALRAIESSFIKIWGQP